MFTIVNFIRQESSCLILAALSQEALPVTS